MSIKEMPFISAQGILNIIHHNVTLLALQSTPWGSRAIPVDEGKVQKREGPENESFASSHRTYERALGLQVNLA